MWRLGLLLALISCAQQYVQAPTGPDVIVEEHTMVVEHIKTNHGVCSSCEHQLCFNSTDLWCCPEGTRCGEDFGCVTLIVP